MQRYITEDERAPGIPEPKAAELPEQFKQNPHKYIAQLNGGNLPYELASELHLTPVAATISMLIANACP